MIKTRSQNIPRIAEIASGRAAIGGLLATSIVGNLTGTSIVQQYMVEKPVVTTFVLATFAATIAWKPTTQQAEIESNSGRLAMVVMGLLIAFDLMYIK